MITLRQLWQPAVYLTWLMLGAVTLLCWLGYWQLSREQQKLALSHQIDHAIAQAPLSEQTLWQTPTENLRFRAIRLQGTFLNEQTVLLDNKINNGKVGYHVLVPVALDSNRLILVNRGWIPLGSSRAHLPIPPPVTGEVIIEGTLDIPSRNPLIRSAIENNHHSWPLRMQNCDLTLLAQILGKPLYPLIINLNKNSPQAFESFQLSQAWLSPERHRGYAVQWFACAFTLFFLYSFYFWRHQRKAT